MATLVGARATRVSAGDVRENEALERLHQAMLNDFSRMKEFKRSNRDARLAPMTEGTLSGNKFSVPIRDYTHTELQTASEEAGKFGMSMTLVRGDLYLCATLPDDSWRGTMMNVVNFITVAAIAIVILFVWKPVLFHALWSAVVSRK